MAFDTDEIEVIKKEIQKTLTTKYVGMKLTDSVLSAVREEMRKAIEKIIPVTLDPTFEVKPEHFDIEIQDLNKVIIRFKDAALNKLITGQ